VTGGRGRVRRSLRDGVVKRGGRQYNRVENGEWVGLEWGGGDGGW